MRRGRTGLDPSDAGRDWPVAALAAAGLVLPGHFTWAKWTSAAALFGERVSAPLRRAVICRRCAALPDLAHRRPALREGHDARRVPASANALLLLIRPQ